MSKHSTRFFVEFLEEYCQTRNIQIVNLADSWLFVLKSTTKNHIVMGYDLGLNTAVSAKICSEKAATFQTLTAFDVPAVPHYLFLPPEKRRYSTSFGKGNWQEILDLHNSFGGKSVVKQDDGSAARNVFFAMDVDQLEESCAIIFSENNNVSLSPFIDLAREVRFIILESEILLCYEFVHPHVIGNGKSSVETLLDMHPEYSTLKTDSNIELSHIPIMNEKYKLGFRRDAIEPNSFPVAMDTIPEACETAVQAFSRLGLRFASIDLVLTGDEWKVLEAHSGVMLEGPSQSSAIPKADLISAYTRALDCMEL